MARDPDSIPATGAVRRSYESPHFDAGQLAVAAPVHQIFELTGLGQPKLLQRPRPARTRRSIDEPLAIPTDPGVGDLTFRHRHLRADYRPATRRESTAESTSKRAGSTCFDLERGTDTASMLAQVFLLLFLPRS